MEQNNIIAHIPVISRAYLDFLDRYQANSDHLYIVDETITHDIDGIRKDLRRLKPNDVVELLSPRLTTVVNTIGRESLAQVLKDSRSIIMPDDEVSTSILHDYEIPGSMVTLDPMFLRWHRLNTEVNINIDSASVNADELPRNAVDTLQNEVQNSKEWWRQVGCVLYKEDTIIESAHNSYTPSNMTAEIDGDIRSQAYRGTSIEIANAKHAEATAIAIAARKGNSLEGASCLVSTFPCPVCAKLLVDAGIKKVYFVDGYAVADGLMILESEGIQVMRVDIDLPEPSTIPIPYQESSERS